MEKLSNRKALLERARHLMNKYMFDALTSIIIAEQELEEQKKKENEGD